MRIFSFPPIADTHSKILILGTMPGNDSLKFAQYYGHKRNAFWHIMFYLTGQSFSEDYETRKQLLLDTNIALWDVLKACERETSLDSHILKEEPNEIKQFLSEHPGIKMIFFNGTGAMKYFEKYIKNIDLPKMQLPSTSPRFTQSVDLKKLEWSEILRYL